MHLKTLGKIMLFIIYKLYMYIMRIYNNFLCIIYYYICIHILRDLECEYLLSNKVFMVKSAFLKCHK